jgi:hypothetical protein
MVDPRKQLQAKIQEVQSLKEENKEVTEDKILDAENLEKYFMRTETTTQT